MFKVNFEQTVLFHTWFNKRLILIPLQFVFYYYNNFINNEITAIKDHSLNP